MSMCICIIAEGNHLLAPRALRVPSFVLNDTKLTSRVPYVKENGRAVGHLLGTT